MIKHVFIGVISGMLYIGIIVSLAMTLNWVGETYGYRMMFITTISFAAVGCGAVGGLVYWSIQRSK